MQLLPAENLHSLIRGVNPSPGAWCYALIKGQHKRLKIWRTKVENDSIGSPGEILAFNPQDGIRVRCGQNTLRIIELQPEGKNSMPAQAFVSGLTKEQFSLHI